MKSRIFFISCVLGSSLLAPKVHSVYFDTLPKGVRLVAYRFVSADKINSTFNNQMEVEENKLHENISADKLKEVDETFNDLLNELYLLSPDAYNNFSFGEYHAEADAVVKANGFGVAYGITNRVTAYASFPIYNASVQVQVQQTTQSTHDAVGDILNQQYGDSSASASLFQSLVRQLPNGDLSHLQSLLVNYYGYRPMGNWSASGLGDTELGLIYNFFKSGGSGMAMTLGLVAPTGKTDDPDLLQDIPFGDGQWDGFAEIGGALGILRRKIYLESSVRYTYQHKSRKKFRLITDPDYPLASQSDYLMEKLGDKINLSFATTFLPSDWLAFKTQYLIETTEKSKFQSPYHQTNQALAFGTDKMNESIKLEISLSTTKLYRKKKFFIPMDLIFSSQKTLRGKNSPNVTRTDLELRIYF